MENNRIEFIKGRDTSSILFWSLAAAILLSLFTAIASGYYFLSGFPALLIVLYLALVDFRFLFYILLAFIPLSTEIQLPGGFGTDLPTEPLMVGLMIVYLLYTIKNGQRMDGRFFRHPITLLLLLHYGWIAATAITSSDLLISFKFFLAKTWYLVTFFFLAGLLLRRLKDIRRALWFLFISLTFTILVTLIRHSFSGFSFDTVHQILHPFYRNHVAYASIMVVFFPFLLWMRSWYPAGSGKRNLLNAALVLYLVAIYLAYTRAAYVALIIALGAYFVIRLRLTRYVLIGAGISVLALTLFLASNNRYLELAPNYERTVTHRDFENLLEATYQGEDISTMERVYRWVAGFYMSREKPALGFGPGTFFFFYKPYTVKSFQTYVSDNPERSGIHSYYLMLIVEQGYIGLLIFLALVFYTLLRGEALYHQLQGKHRGIVMTTLLSLIIILALLIINDLIETDKIGPFFFMYLALIVNLDRWAQTEGT